MSYLIEFEGYSFPKRFIFKEVTILNLQSDEYSCYFIKSPYLRKYLSAHEKRIVNYCATYLHKIDWFTGIHQISVLKDHFSLIKPGEKVYTKGLQKCNILKQFLHSDITLIDLEDCECEKASVYLKNIEIKNCILDQHKNSAHCSFLKAQAFQSFIKNQKQS